MFLFPLDPEFHWEGKGPGQIHQLGKGNLYKTVQNSSIHKSKHN